MTEPTPFAALLDGLPRYNGRYRDRNGCLVRLSDVLARFAAVPTDLATVCCPKCSNTGWVLGPQLDKYPEEDMDSPAHEATLYICDGVVHSLLVRIAAQEAQIAGLEATVERFARAHERHLIAGAETRARAEAAETALAAERAKVAKMVDLLCLADEAIMQEHGCFPMDRTNERQIFLNDACTAIRKITGDDYTERKRRALAAITEAGQ